MLRFFLLYYISIQNSLKWHTSILLFVLSLSFSPPLSRSPPPPPSLSLTHSFHTVNNIEISVNLYSHSINLCHTSHTPIFCILCFFLAIFFLFHFSFTLSSVLLFDFHVEIFAVFEYFVHFGVEHMTAYVALSSKTHPIPYPFNQSVAQK